MFSKQGMYMQSLQKYIDQKNQWASLFKGQRTEPLYEVDTAAGRKRVAGMIDSDLSPENLSCDGELPMTQVRARYRVLTAAARDLVKLDPSMAQYMYEFG
jgi:hypothetical protein